MSTLLEVCLAEWGEAERVGTGFNPRIAEYLKTCGLGPSDETPWCAALLTWAAVRAGVVPPPLPAIARSWLTVGQSVTNPRVGDIVVLQRGETWQGHVGLFVRKHGNNLLVLGGNQNDQVGIQAFPESALLGLRRLRL